ncbi:14390_t:CDS:1, partial [Entrophospora sp. SA101]
YFTKAGTMILCGNKLSFVEAVTVVVVCKELEASEVVVVTTAAE